MEQPYGGRAIIQDNLTDIQITIPARKNWFIILFLGAWLCGWLLGETFAIGAVIGLFKGNPAGLFILFWLAGWTLGGLFALKTLLWMINGKEIIAIGQGILSINKKNDILFKPKTYDLNEVKNIRAQDDSSGYGGVWGGRRSDLGPLNTSGTIRFDYGFKTVKFAGGIDEAEANFIIQKLKERHLLTDKNYS